MHSQFCALHVINSQHHLEQSFGASSCLRWSWVIAFMWFTICALSVPQRCKCQARMTQMEKEPILHLQHDLWYLLTNQTLAWDQAQIAFQDWSGDNWQWLEWYQSMYNICSVIEQGCFQREKAALQHKGDREMMWPQSILLGIGGNPEMS